MAFECAGDIHVLNYAVNRKNIYIRWHLRAIFVEMASEREKESQWWVYPPYFFFFCYEVHKTWSEPSDKRERETKPLAKCPFDAKVEHLWGGAKVG